MFGVRCPVADTLRSPVLAGPKQISCSNLPDVTPALVRLSRIALLVAVGDLLTKQLAATLWSVQALHISSWLSLAVIQNHGGAFGLSAGSYTWQLNLALTLAAIVFVIPVTKELSAVDAQAPVGLGLIVGGALGNMVSLLAPPAGVGDFMAVHWSASRGLVLNLADIAAYTGLALILRTGFRIAAAIAAQAKKEPVGVVSAYAAKSEAKKQLRRIRVYETPELVVRDWTNVADLGIVRGDGPELVTPVLALSPKPRRTAPAVGESAPLTVRPHGAPELENDLGPVT